MPRPPDPSVAVRARRNRDERAVGERDPLGPVVERFLARHRERSRRREPDVGVGAGLRLEVVSPRRHVARQPERGHRHAADGRAREAAGFQVVSHATGRSRQPERLPVGRVDAAVAGVCRCPRTVSTMGDVLRGVARSRRVRPCHHANRAHGILDRPGRHTRRTTDRRGRRTSRRRKVHVVVRPVRPGRQIVGVSLLVGEVEHPHRSTVRPDAQHVAVARIVEHVDVRRFLRRVPRPACPRCRRR